MKYNVAKTSLMLMIVTVLAKVLGFGRELVLASTYGANMYSDAYLVALNIPTVIFASLGIAISTMFIPVYTEIENNQGEKDAIQFANNTFNIIACVCIIISILGLVFAEDIVHILAIGFKGEIFKVCVDFTRILMIGIIFVGLTYLANAYLQIKGNFLIPGIISLPYNIIIIIAIIMSVRYSSYIMVWGTLIGIIVQLLLQIPSILKSGYKYRFTIDLKDSNLRKVVVLVAPVFLGVAVNQINTMIDRTLASTLIEGSISALNYANKLNLFVMTLFITSISTAVYPLLSKLSSINKNKKEFIDTIIRSINSIILLVMPISVGAILLSKPIVKLLFQRGGFDSRATTMTSIALTMYSIGMLAFGLREILGKVFYSLQDTKTPMINGIITVVINIFLNIILMKYLQLAGLALSTSISSIFCVFLLFKSLQKKIGYFGQDKIIKTTIKSIIAVIPMGIMTLISYKFLYECINKGLIGDMVALIISIAIGAIIYGIAIIIQKVDEINIIINLFKNKFNLLSKTRIKIFSR